MRSALALFIATVAAVTLGACADDDGANVRSAGSVVVIGPPPPAGGGSVSAVGSGCTTKGATTKVVSASVQIELDEFSIAAAGPVSAGVNRMVVKNFGSGPHELVIVAGTVATLPVVDGFVDEEALAANGTKIMRLAAFPANTICEGTFELPAGSYVLFGNQAAPSGSAGRSEFELGMVLELAVT
jgi:hypothetical protein